MTDGDRKRLVITEEDLGPSPQQTPALSPPPAPVASGAGGLQPEPMTQLPTVEGVAPSRLNASPVPPGGPSHGVAAFLGTVRGRNVTAAACGIALGWAVCEITGFGLWTPTTSLGQDAATAAYTGAVGFFFAVVYAGWESILARSWEGVRRWLVAAGPLGFGLAFVAGFIAEIVYRHFVIQILRGLTFEGLVNIDSNIKLYLTRALAWGLFGLGMGIAVAGTKSREKLINGVAGGAVGGALGGLVFHWASFNISSGAVGRLVGLLVVGISIGLAIGIVETLRRDAWLHITGGPMAGKEFIVYGNSFTLGSSPKCDLTLIKDPAIAHFHAAISTVEEPGGPARTLDAYQGCLVSLNGAAIARHRLRSGDLIGVGATAIMYSERATTV